MTITYVIIGLTFVLDLAYSLFFYRGRADEDTLVTALFLCKSTFTYILYFILCQFASLDIAKIEMLKNASRLHGPLVCLVIASQQFMVAIVFERYIKKVIIDFWACTIIEFICNVAAMIAVYDMLRSELDEMERMSYANNN